MDSLSRSLSISTKDNSVKIRFKYNKKYIISLIFYFIILCILPLVALILMKINDFHASVSSVIANIFFIISYIISLITLFAIVIKNHRRHGDYTVTYNITREKFIKTIQLEKAIVIICAFVAVLGIGDSVLNLCQLTDIILIIINEDHKHESAIIMLYDIVSIIEYGVKSIYHICLLIFVLYHEKFRQTLTHCPSKYFIACLSVSCLYQWILIILEDVHHGTEMYSKKNINVNATAIQVNQTSLILFDKYEKFLYPLAIEFRITLFIEFACLAFKVDQDGYDDEGYSSAILNSIRNGFNWFLVTFLKAVDFIFQKIICFQINKQPSLNGHVEVQRKEITFVEYCFTFFLIIISVFLTCVAFIIVVFRDNNSNVDPDMVRAVAEICHFVLLCAALIYVSILFFVIVKNSRIEKSHIHSTHNSDIEKKIDFFILFLSNLSLVVYHILSIIASSYSINKGTSKATNSNDEFIKYIELLYSIVPIIESTLQFYVVWLLENKIKINKEYIQILILLNFSLWLFDTFSVVFILLNKIPINLYSSIIWKSIVTVFLPLSIFYRFHSCIVLVKINVEKYVHNHEE